MLCVKFIGDLIKAYDKDHKPLSFNTVLSIENRAIDKPLIKYHGEEARLLYMTIYKNLIVLELYTQESAKNIFSTNILYVMRADINDRINLLSFHAKEYNNIFIVNQTLDFHDNDCAVYEDRSKQEATILYIKDSVVQYFLVLTGKFGCDSKNGNLSERTIINNLHDKEPDLVDNIIAWRVLSTVRNK